MSRLDHRPEWQVFRRAIIEHDEGVCQMCERPGGDGVILQIHHKVYQPGRLPWLYDPRDCETLCKGCHAQKHGKIPPSSEWDFLFEEDLGDLAGECEYCGTEIRYVYYIHHPRWETLAVGTDCCDRLTGSDVAITHRRMLDRRTRFLKSSKWRREGATWRITRMHMDFVVDHDNRGWLICFMGRRGRKRYDSLKAVKEALFKFIDTGGARKFKLEHE